MAFTPQFLDELRMRIGVADVVGKRVRLVKKGREHHGLCPFHKEKTPSFTVNEEKGFYHCFGCGAHGSAIDFIMETEGLNFPEAVERLAGDAGMEVPQDTPQERERAEKRKSLYDVVEAASAFFERTLYMPEGRIGLDYFRRRGLSDATLKSFRLGYAPDSREALQAHMSREGYTAEQMIEAGLIIQPDDRNRKPYDRFRGRVMFPIADRRGRVVAFGGRILEENQGGKKLAKYLNSPETPLFHKGHMLYALHHAQAAARQAGTIIVTEGYMDVIALAEAGMAHAVAPLGTALTEEQILELWKVVPEPILCFDGDKAGQRAAGRAAERVLPVIKPGHALRFAMLPGGEDPDSLIANKGRAAFEAVLQAAKPLSEMLWDMEAEGGLPSTPEARAALQKRMEDHTKRIQDPIVRSHFQRAFKDRLWEKRPSNNGGAEKQWSKGSGSRSGKGRWGEDKIGPSRPVGGNSKEKTNAARGDMNAQREGILLATLIGHPDLMDNVEERLGTMTFAAASLDNLRQEVLNTLAGDSGLDSRALQSHLKQCGYNDALTALLSPEVFIHARFAQPEGDAQAALRGWEETYAMHHAKDLQTEILQAQRRLATERTQEAFEQLRALKALEQERAERDMA